MRDVIRYMTPRRVLWNTSFDGAGDEGPLEVGQTEVVLCDGQRTRIARNVRQGFSRDYNLAAAIAHNRRIRGGDAPWAQCLIRVTKVK